jgi:RNA-binding protein YlmH
VIIDRIEEHTVYVEDDAGEIVRMKRETLPENIREGDVLIPDGHGSCTVDAEATRMRREKARARLNRLLGR